MKNMLLILTAVLIASSAHAGYSSKIQYWYSQNVSEDIPKLKEIAHLQQKGKNASSTVITWKIDNPPTKAVIDAIDNQVAMDFISDYRKDKNAAPDKASIDAQALIEVVAELTGNTEDNVKKKFKKAKKKKEKK